MKQPAVWVVVGPTATGKTDLAVSLAQLLGGEVVSADSMQVYRGMDIGTAKPTQAERQGIPHHMIDVVEPDEAYSAALYQAQANRCIEGILQRGRVPVVAGGTGLYINALTYDLDFSRTRQDTALREELNQKDTAELYDLLKQADPSAAVRIHPNNKRRVIRAIEIAASGTASESTYDFDRPSKQYAFHIVGLTCERPILYQKIGDRVDKMMAAGLPEEVGRLYQAYGMRPISMQGIGYKEFAPYFTGKASLEEVAAAIKQNTRRFAKRQMTWFKRDGRINWFDCALENLPHLVLGLPGADLDREHNSEKDS